MRAALNKLNDEGIVRPDARGGRHASLREKDSATRSAVLAHIQLFPRMESHFCRQSTTREYLHPDLTIKKMYYFYVQEGRQPQCSYHTYRRVFKSLNLSFHHPKKDQCNLCSSYKEGSTETKAKLEDSFAAHIAEKDSVRKKKKDAKESSQENPEIMEIKEKVEAELGVKYNEGQIWKKIQNIKTRLKAKTDRNQTGNKPIKLKGWEQELLNFLQKSVDYTPTACAEEETITEEASGSSGPVLEATIMKAGPSKEPSKKNENED
ncbi:unnamed protein product [Acanthoscelides obtectus]|uniref:Uncharacterized protein n=1 Tax=Acanthoscelides obtectus TaxID=200917 RepID=A0A9P0PC41_ACAOB|nr:unnamed protein product [Acanthoscelides obtectus]CAK1633078.1 hypothetical protein AOBTE_LOCUS7931 [Acanthoscelides obtectus]